MDHTHETMLTDVLRDTLVYGAATVSWHKFYRWLDADRMTKKKWQDVQRRWELLVTDEFKEPVKWRLGFADHGRDDFLTLICLDPEGAKESWLKPISAKFES